VAQFVIHKHDARTLHYDFRLEVDGALRSWAVPKGPSTDPSEKRMATPTEDHPMSYADFEGVIPPEDYGAGTVLVWDTGSFRNLGTDDGDEVPIGQALDGGHATIWLDGHKLRGGYALTRIRTGDDEAWLLTKTRDEEADARRNPVSTQPDSVLTGRGLDAVREDEGGAQEREA
jgi:DNA ligase D-like protein (predicted 3'-phosphoesterase)